jgi:hypothetical protein
MDSCFIVAGRDALGRGMMPNPGVQTDAQNAGAPVMPTR